MMWDPAWSSRLLVVVLVLPFGACAPADGDLVPLGTISVATGDVNRSGMPVRYECRLAEILPPGLSPDSLPEYQLLLIDKGKPEVIIPVQWDEDTSFPWEDNGEGALVWIMDDRSQCGLNRTFDLVMKRGGAWASPFSIDNCPGRHVLVRRGEAQVLQYNYGVVHQTAGETGPFDRAAYIHPLWTPGGRIVTGDFSPEHIHQRGIFLAFRKVKFDEIETEFWGLGDTLGRILPDKIQPEFAAGPAQVKLTLHNLGVVSGQPYFREVWGIRIYASSGKDYRMFDIVVKQLPVDPENPAVRTPRKTMRLGQLHYGGMSFRGPSNWLHKNSGDVTRALAQGIEFPGVEWLPSDVELDVLTSEGLTREDGNQTRARWIDYTGPLMDGWGGISMFCHPENPAHPTPVRIHPELPYFSYALTQDGPVTVSSEEPLSQQFRVLAHDGRPDRHLNEWQGAHYGNPPVISFDR